MGKFFEKILILLTIVELVSSDGNEKIKNYQKRSGKKFLDEIAKKENVIKLKSGLLVEVITESTIADPKSPNIGDTCEVSYSGTLKDGTKFDSGKTKFAPNQVIKGWTEAMQYMVEGDKWKLYIPYDLAYGEHGSPPKIPPFAPLVFDIEIHKVKSGGKSKEKARSKMQENIVNAETIEKKDL